MGVCEPLMTDVVASKAQLQLCKLSGPTFGFTTQELSITALQATIEVVATPFFCRRKKKEKKKRS